MVELSTLNLDFRNKTDLLFFTNRLDIDLSNYRQQFAENNDHYQYLLDRFFKGTEIFWDNLAEVWKHRFELLLSLDQPTLSRGIEKDISKKMFTLLKKKQEVSQAEIGYIQYLELIKAKAKRKESLSQTRNYLLELPDSIKPKEVIKIIESFIPYVFKDLNDYMSYLCKRVIYSTRNLIILQELKLRGFQYNVELLKDRMDLIIESDACLKLSKAFVALLREEDVALYLKNKFSPGVSKKILTLVEQLSFKEIEADNFFLFKVLTEISPDLTNGLLENYLINLFYRGSKHIKSNSNKIFKLSKACPIFSSKVIFSYLLSIDKINYIKSLCVFFPEYKNLLPFV